MRLFVFYNEDVIDIIHKWLRIPHLLHVGVDLGPRRPKQTIVFIHGIANSHAMWEKVISKIDTSETRIISVDLLGFGQSPKPTWQIYNAHVHARSLRLTLRKRGVRSPVMLVGHSLGSLIAIQYAHRYKNVDSLLLCSPPFYKPTSLAKEIRLALPAHLDDTYHMIYRSSRYRQDLALRMALFMKSSRLLSKYFSVTSETMPAILSSLEMSIENQTSLEDAKTLSVPVHILYGQFDPFIIKRHLRELKKANSNVSTTILPVGHEIAGPIYRKAIHDQIKRFIRLVDTP